MEFIPYGKHEIKEEDIEAVKQQLKDIYITQGNRITEFEQAITRKVGARYGVATNSATSALHLSCIALGLEKGDELWTSPISFVASANCGLYCGAKVDFVDINPITGLLDVEKLESKLIRAKRRNKIPKVVVPVHLTGASCDMHNIDRLAKEYGFKVIEDASHAIGGKYKGEYVGSCKYSDVTVFSFHPVKIITTGEGGLAATNSLEIAKKIEELRSHGITKDDKRFKFPSNKPWKYEQQMLGYNYRLNDIEAALGLSQLKRLDSIVRERQQQHQYYKELLRESRAELLEIPKEVDSSVHIAVIRIKGTTEEEHLKVFNNMRRSGIGVQLHYSPIYLQPYYRNLGFQENYCLNAEKYEQEAMTIPLYPGLKRNEQEFIAETLKKYITQ